MVILYTILIIHIQRGNKNTWLKVVSSLLLLNNVGACAVGYGLFKLMILKDITKGLVWMIAVGCGVDYLTFSVAHFMLASKYSKMATNIPLLLEGKSEKPVTTCDRIFYWTMLALNFLAGFCTGLFLLFFRMQTIWRNQPALPWMPTCFNVAQECVMVLQIYSGIILVRSVYKIRRFFVERNAKNFINTDMLIRHSACFILYIITVTTFYVAFGYYTFRPTT